MTTEDKDADKRVPAAGGDPDSRQRLAKTLAASGVDDLEGLSVDPVTDEDRQDAVDRANEAEQRRQSAMDKAHAAEERAANAGESQLGKTTPPQGRSATPAGKGKTAA